MPPERRFPGNAASPRSAAGRARVVGEYRVTVVPPSKADDVRSELLKFDAALARSRDQLESMRATHTSAESVSVLEGQLNILADPVFIRWVIQHIKQEHWSAARAVNHVINRLSSQFADMDDSYLAGRDADVQDVGHRIRKNLLGEDPNELLDIDRTTIVVAGELKPSTVVQLEQNPPAGIVMARGAPTSHAAIMARGLGIPCLVGAKGVVAHVRNGDEILIDGEASEAILHPTEETREALRPALEAAQEEPVAEETAPRPDLTTSDGVRIFLRANISLGAEVRSLGPFGAEGVGLFRTEFLFMGRTRPPDREAQFRSYSRAVRDAQGQVVTFRTIDAGGDKDMPAFSSKLNEANPALGVRSIRLCLREEGAFRDQLAAILQASAEGPVRLMYPMITTLEDLDRANRILDSVKEELDEKGVAFDRDLEAGMMVEVPASALQARLFASRVRFFSIGTNDLAQFLMAADRQNPEVQTYLDGAHPALLEVVRGVVRAARENEIPVSCCGEMPAEAVGFAILLGLGVQEFSMNLFAVPRIREIASRIHVGELEQIMLDVRDAASAAEVRQRVEQYLDGVAPPAA